MDHGGKNERQIPQKRIMQRTIIGCSGTYPIWCERWRSLEYWVQNDPFSSKYPFIGGVLSDFSVHGLWIRFYRIFWLSACMRSIRVSGARSYVQKYPWMTHQQTLWNHEWYENCQSTIWDAKHWTPWLWTNVASQSWLGRQWPSKLTVSWVQTSF